MSILKLFLPLVAIAGSAYAQLGCQASTNTIQNSGDAEVLRNCQIISGDLVIAEQATGTIRLSGIGRINGSLISRNAVGLSSIEAPNLATIDKAFILDGLTILDTLNFPSLSSVGAIEWRALPALQELSFTSGVKRASEVRVENTNLKSLDGINLEQVRIFEVFNNPYLAKLDLQLGNITQALTVGANSRDIQVTFPNLQWAYNMTFRNCSSVDLPSLSSVNGSMGFFENYFESFSAPQLTQTGPGGFLVFVDNQRLTNISLPKLKTIGGTYQIANNTQLKIIDGFQQLSTVGGAIDFSGNFTNVTLPAIQDVRGAFNMQTSSQFDCSPFQNAKNRGIIKGRFVCSGNQARPGTASSGNQPSGTGSSSNPTRTSGAGQINANALALGSFSAAVVGWLFFTM